MKLTLLALATALALAGCHRDQNQRATSASPAATPSSSSGAGSTAPQSNTPSTPANIGAPSSAESKQPPVQGREDVRQPEQRKDFQHSGDGAGPRSPDTEPSSKSASGGG